MASTSRGNAAPTDGDGLASSRIRFLTAEPVEESGVRPAILASWRRSRDLKVAADKIALPYIRDPDFETPLTRSAEPVLRRLREQLDGQPMSIILTDPTGLVLSRRTGDTDLERHLDSVLLSPGFSYGEQFVGTNGIGTAVETGTATHVFGHEHYAENLEDLACAGVPIHDPISGRTVGVVDLTCWRRDAGSLLLTLAKTTAEQIRQALLDDSGPHELELMQAYRRTCRRFTGVVFALTNDTVMVNDYARAVLDPADQAALIGQAAQAVDTLAPGHRGAVVVQLPSGAAGRMYCQQVRVGGEIAGVVVHVKLGESDSHQARDLVARASLPGLVGHAPLWQRACHEVEDAFRSGEWVAVAGEPGVGKLALLRAVQLHRQPAGRFAVVDVADAATDPEWLDTVRRALLENSDSVVVRHVDTLDSTQVRALAAALRQACAVESDRAVWVAVTLEHAGGKELGRLLRLFPSTVEVPPLRLHLEDLEELVPFFLSRLGHGGQMTCSPEAMRLLMRSSWPGNVEQLHHLLHGVVQHRRGGAIRAEDLPPEAQTVSRRLLSPLESMERDAIVHSLSDAHGNKVKAAQALGMSRATIYRKIHQYGIVELPAQSRQPQPVR